MKRITIIALIILCISSKGWTQESTEVVEASTLVNNISSDYKPMDPLAPSRAAFYSAIVPGLGQIFNKKYWKLPLVYAAVGTPIYFYVDNDSKYRDYRNEYKKRLRGIYDTEDPVFGKLDNDRVIQGQQFYQRNRDLSLVVAIGFYILNVVDANIDAHLMQFNVNDKLTIQPAMEYNPRDLNQYQYAINIQYSF
ncbi:DUF5683 domain-containing protein [Myroides guanonis]|uniref:DUF5683 domain-containing protein n=1 Tax=Myroides guanonis TaxID=1150112 RepID=A0A1I3UE62_9FLAO|nr:DUF5683 domain-containing protein [Myroides guanonis]SFJ81202.1 hypothetical protein SAMN04487893_11735 [Myroides guanonis]